MRSNFLKIMSAGVIPKDYFSGYLLSEAACYVDDTQ